MLNDPLVSVIIPVYNRQNIVKRAISSAIQQSYDNLEIVVVDDASTDNTVRQIKKRFSDEVKLFEKSRNTGVAHARNIGINNSKGKYVAFLDSDDEWYSNKVEVQVNNLNHAGDNVALVDSDWNTVLPSGKVVTKKKGAPTLQKVLSFNRVCSPPTVLARRSILIAVGMFDESLSSAEDADLWVRILKEYEIIHTSQALTCVHREHSSHLGGNVADFVTGHCSMVKKHSRIYECRPSHVLSDAYLHIGRRVVGLGRKQIGKKFISRSIKTDPFNLSSYMWLLYTYASPAMRGHLRYMYKYLLNVLN